MAKDSSNWKLFGIYARLGLAAITMGCFPWTNLTIGDDPLVFSSGKHDSSPRFLLQVEMKKVMEKKG